MTADTEPQGDSDPSSETAYLICKSCAWVLPILHTADDERCPECDGSFVVVDDAVLREVG